MMYNACTVLVTPAVNRLPMLFDIKQGNESLTSPSGLAWIGLLGLGQPDFAAIEAFRADPFFRAALHLDQVPSEATLRLRLDSTRGGRAWRLGKAIRGIGSVGGSISASPRPPAPPRRRGKAVQKGPLHSSQSPGGRRGLCEKPIGGKSGGNSAGNSTEIRSRYSGNNATVGKTRFTSIIIRDGSSAVIFGES